MAKLDPHVAAHLEWIGFVQPIGLVVSAPALVRAGAILDRRDAEGQRLLRECVRVEERAARAADAAAAEPRLPDFRAFASSVLGWSFSPAGYAGTDEAPIPPELEAALPDSGGVLSPDFAVRSGAARRVPAAPAVAGSRLEAREPTPAYGASPRMSPDASPWQLLVHVHEPGEGFDRVTRGPRGVDGLEASPHGCMERLLRQTGVPAGLLFNGASLRLISAPRGESSGWLDFRVSDMLETAGRPISTAMRLLLGETRLLGLPSPQRLAALLEESRKYQNEVSERLAEQVLHALYELLRGFQAAHDASKGELLRESLDEQPDEVYRALLTVILRLVFLLYAEERGLLPEDDTFVRYYSLAGLHERLREDAAVFPDTMDQRYGAWAQLLVLFRMFHDGAASGAMRLPPRHGAIFDPDRYRFLEGRPSGGARQTVGERVDAPLVPDGTLYRALDKLLVLGGERISYRALDVEQIGSVYETMMGFRLETATGRSAAIKAARKQGAPATIDLDALLAEPPEKRRQWIQDRTDRKITDRVQAAVRVAATLDDLHAALDPVLDKAATPDLIPAGAMVLQPSQERRRSGSHYTPRALTEPIVRTTLEPILARLGRPAGRDGEAGDGRPPRPEDLLDLKVCDPAIGSGAFLVEACRQLGDALVEAWHVHDALPPIPPDEDERTFAMRLVAQRCLYGVDRNPVAVDLTKMSLWLTTLAKDHSLTFIDHALRHGDSLVGLTRTLIEAFHWKGGAPRFPRGFEAMRVREHVEEVAALSRRIREAGEEVSEPELRLWWRDARDELDKVRIFGDLVLAAFFGGAKPKAREDLRKRFADAVQRGETIRYRSWLEELRRGEPPLAPFHWEIEYPEVFDRANPGFDAIVGNPPFAGKNTVAAANVAGYPDWLKQAHAGSHGNADLVAHFFRRAFDLVRRGGAFGLIATNTIAQGDTRSTGLRWICEKGGEIYRARRRVKWPGLAAVVVSVLHVSKGRFTGGRRLDDDDTDRITAFLFHRGGHDDPERLEANAGKSFQGSIVLGMGFTFDDTDRKGVATPLAEMRRLVDESPRNGDAIFPYIGGEEVNTSPTHAHHRYVINFRDWPLRREDLGARPSGSHAAGTPLPAPARQLSAHRPAASSSGVSAPAPASWADATEAERREWLRTGIVPPHYPGPVAADWPELLAIVEERVKPERLTQNDKSAKVKWWQFIRPRPELHAAISGLERVLAISRVSEHTGLAFLQSGTVYNDRLIIFPFETYAVFCALQSRPHEIWARFFGSSLEDRLTYTPSDCFETFPFPENWEIHSALEAAGKTYYDFRAALMIENDEGMTKTYNRFHDPYETDPRIAELRELHAAMDRAVLDAYGWHDIATDCDFLLDYEIDETTWGRKKKPYRYRWPDEVRDEVLARLLELNAECAAEEARAGANAQANRGPSRSRQRKISAPAAQAPLWQAAGGPGQR